MRTGKPAAIVADGPTVYSINLRSSSHEAGRRVKVTAS